MTPKKKSLHEILDELDVLDRATKILIDSIIRYLQKKGFKEEEIQLRQTSRMSNEKSFKIFTTKDYKTINIDITEYIGFIKLNLYLVYFDTRVDDVRIISAKFTFRMIDRSIVRKAIESMINDLLNL